MKSRIGYNLIISLILFSSLITLITTAFQLYFDYRTDIKRVNNYESLIQKSYLNSLANNVWLYNDTQVKTQLHGILHLQDMEYIHIQSDEGTDWEFGSIKSKSNLTKEFPLLYEHKGDIITIGVLTTVISLDGIYIRLSKRVFTILFSNAVKTFLVSGFILLIFQYLVTRHLNSLSNWLKNLDIGRSFETFKLDRNPSKPQKNDELDEVVIAINEMQDNLKRNINNLINSEKNYRSLFENAVMGIFQSTPEGRLISVNQAFARIHGYESSEEVLEKVSDIGTQLYVNPVDRKRYRQILQESGQVENFIHEALRKDGSRFWVSNFTRADFDPDGKIIQYEGTLIDITDRKKAEDLLQKSETQLRTLIDSIPDLVWLKDLNGVYLSCNSKFERFFGAKESDIVGKTDYDFVDKELADFFRENDKIAMNAGVPSMNEEEITYADDGHKENLETVKTPIYNLDKQPIGVLGIARDITERKNAEKEKAKLVSQLQQSQKMESIGTLAGGIAHDFNNILYPLIGFAEMLQDDLPPDSPEQDSISEVLQSALRAKDLVKQILTFSRQSEQELKPIRVQSILNEAIGLLKSSIPTTIDIQTDIDPDCGVVIADPTQIHQVIINLATNAYHAMQESGGQLSVILKQTEIDSSPTGLPRLLPGKYALLKVIDTGTGIKKSVMDRIFEPYFTTKEIGKGTGLGLSVVQGIIKNCQGDIHVYSEPGMGTEFHLYLPVLNKSSGKNTPKLPRPVQGGSERILLVDDEEAIIKMEKQMLERLGYHVTGKSGSTEALEIFKTDPEAFDLIISDMTMPNMTGLQLASKIKAIKPHIPIIICTGFSDQINDETIKKRSIQAVVIKPVIKKEIAKTIREVLSE